MFIGFGDRETLRRNRRFERRRFSGANSGSATKFRSSTFEFLEPRHLLAASDVLGNHYDAGSTGQTLTETVLTPSNVNSTTFGKRFTTTLDGQVYAQILAVANVNITRGSLQGIHNVLYAATMHNSLYAVDADTGAILWQDNFSQIADPRVTTINSPTPTTGVTTFPAVPGNNVLINGNDVGPELGILATPTIDLSTSILYLVADTQEFRTGITPAVSGDRHFVQRLWAINLSDGSVAITPNNPANIPASGGQIVGDVIKSDSIASNNYTSYKYVAGPYIKGTGNNSDTFNFNGTVATTNNADGWAINSADATSIFAGTTPSATGYVAFNALLQMNRVATTLINGEIYLGFASHGDDGPYYGWLLGYSASTLANNAAFVTVPTFDGVKGSAGFTSVGGLWASGGGITTDGTYLYFTVGNGSFNNAASNFNANYFGTTTNGAHVLMPKDGDYGDSVLKVALDFNATQANINLKNAAAGNPTPNGQYTPELGYNVNGYGLKVVDYFTPSNARILNTIDADIGSGGVLLIPSTGPGSATAPNGDQMLVTAGKEGRVYLIDAGNMGGFNTQYVTDGHDVSGSAATTNPAPYDRVLGEYFYRQANGNPTIFANDQTNKGYEIPSWFNGKIYVGLSGANELGFTVSSLLFPAGPTSSRTSTYAAPSFRTSTTIGSRGVTAAISANGLTNGIVWNNLVAQNSTDSLAAYSASATGTVNQIYSSNTNTARDQLTANVTGATGVKFSVPTVFNGMVYVGTGGGSSVNTAVRLGTLVGYGLLSTTLTAPTTLAATAGSGTGVHLSWTRNTTSETHEVVERSTNGTSFTAIAYLPNGATTYEDNTTGGGTQYFYRVRAISGPTIGSPSAVANIITAPAMTAAVSRKPHGNTNFDLNLPLGGTPGIEPRLGGPSRIIFTFGQALDTTSHLTVALSSGVGNVTYTGSGTVTQIALEITTPATDGQTLSVTLGGVRAAGGTTVGTYTFNVGVLLGDVNQSGMVTTNDVNLVKQNSGVTLDNTNFLSDVNRSSATNIADINIVKLSVGHSLTPAGDSGSASVAFFASSGSQTGAVSNDTTMSASAATNSPVSETATDSPATESSPNSATFSSPFTGTVVVLPTVTTEAKPSSIAIPHVAAATVQAPTTKRLEILAAIFGNDDASFDKASDIHVRSRSAGVFTDGSFFDVQF